MMFKSINSLLPFLLFASLFLGCRGDAAQKTSHAKALPVDKLSELKLLTQQEPENAGVFNEIALYYLSKDNFSDALHNINRSLEIEPANTKFFITLSEIYLMMGDAELAKLSLFRAQELEPNNADIFVHLGRLQVYMQDYQRAFVNLRRALELDKNNSKAYFWRGLARLENGDTTRAISDWQLAVANDPESYEGYFKLGLLMAERKDRFALDYLKHALRLAPPEPELLYDIGMAFQEIERFGNAIETYEKILTIDTCFYKAWFNIGFIHLVERVEFENSIDHFSKALQCKNDYVDAVFNRGLAYELLGDYLNARKDYRHALEISINYEKAIEGLNRLDQIQSSL